LVGAALAELRAFDARVIGPQQLRKNPPFFGFDIVAFRADAGLQFLPGRLWCGLVAADRRGRGRLSTVRGAAVSVFGS
jgi:hypothetical protein